MRKELFEEGKKEHQDDDGQRCDKNPGCTMSNNIGSSAWKLSYCFGPQFPLSMHGYQSLSGPGRQLCF